MAILYGDIEFMLNGSGENDELIAASGGRNIENYLFGDSYFMTGTSYGGDDVLTGGAGSSTIRNFIYGDAYSINENSQGGNDVLTGGAGSSENHLFGDAFEISCADDDPGLERKTYGGDDMLIGGVGSTKNNLYGDAVLHTGGIIICGDDYLISRTGNDDMWGDIAFSYSEGNPLDLSQVTTGNDVFVFSAGNGTDTIHDFRQGEDKIELKGLVANFDALESHIATILTDSTITFGNNTITVLGVTGLTVEDFLFT